jgi:hypothetical protein
MFVLNVFDLNQVAGRLMSSPDASVATRIELNWCGDDTSHTFKSQRKAPRETKLGRKMNYGCVRDGSCSEAYDCAND